MRNSSEASQETLLSQPLRARNLPTHPNAPPPPFPKNKPTSPPAPLPAHPKPSWPPNPPPPSQAPTPSNTDALVGSQALLGIRVSAVLLFWAGSKLARSWLKFGSNLALFGSFWLFLALFGSFWLKVGSKLAQSWLKVGSKLAQSWLKVGSKLALPCLLAGQKGLRDFFLGGGIGVQPNPPPPPPSAPKHTVPYPASPQPSFSQDKRPTRPTNPSRN